jgi:hypothetical protein
MFASILFLIAFCMYPQMFYGNVQQQINKSGHPSGGSVDQRFAEELEKWN